MVNSVGIAFSYPIGDAIRFIDTCIFTYVLGDRFIDTYIHTPFDMSTVCLKGEMKEKRVLVAFSVGYFLSCSI